jgi:hypothetical protein
MPFGKFELSILPLGRLTWLQMDVEENGLARRIAGFVRRKVNGGMGLRNLTEG